METRRMLLKAMIAVPFGAALVMPVLSKPSSIDRLLDVVDNSRTDPNARPPGVKYVSEPPGITFLNGGPSGVIRANEGNMGWRRLARGDYAWEHEGEALTPHGNPIDFGIFMDMPYWDSRNGYGGYGTGGGYPNGVTDSDETFADGVGTYSKTSPMVITDSPAKMSLRLKRMALFLGADLPVRITAMQPFMYYGQCLHNLGAAGIKVQGTMRPEDYPAVPDSSIRKFGIVWPCEMPYREVTAGTGFDEFSSQFSLLTYSLNSFVSINMANVMNKMGYDTQAHHGAQNYNVLMQTLMIWSGAAENGLCAFPITPEIGGRYKNGAVDTNMELAPDEQFLDIGMQAYCQACRKCYDNCPGSAITGTNVEVMQPGGPPDNTTPIGTRNYKTWMCDQDKCVHIRGGPTHGDTNNGTGCDLCIRTCPWSNKPSSWWHDIGEWAVADIPSMNSLLVWIEDQAKWDLEPIPEDMWWSDIDNAKPAFSQKPSERPIPPTILPPYIFAPDMS